MPEPTDTKPTGCGAFLVLVLAVALVWGFIDWMSGGGPSGDDRAAADAADPSADGGPPRSQEAGTTTSEFLDLVRQEAPSFAGAPDYQLLLQGENVCDADDAGTEEYVIRGVYIDAGLTASETGALVYAAREELC